MPQLAISFHKVQSQFQEWVDCILLSHWAPPKNYMLLPMLSVVLYSLIIRLYCWRQHIFDIPVIKHREIYSVPNENHHPYWITIMVLKGTIYVTKGESIHQYIPVINLEPYTLIKIYWFNNGTNVIRVTKLCLIGIKVYSMR